MKLKLPKEPVTGAPAARLACATRAPEPLGNLTWCCVPSESYMPDFYIHDGQSGSKAYKPASTKEAAANIQIHMLPQEVSARVREIDAPTAEDFEQFWIDFLVKYPIEEFAPAGSVQSIADTLKPIARKMWDSSVDAWDGKRGT